MNTCEKELIEKVRGLNDKNFKRFLRFMEILCDEKRYAELSEKAEKHGMSIVEYYIEAERNEQKC